MNDLTNLQQQLTTSTNADVANKLFTWIMLPSIILAIIIVVLYILAVIRRHKVESAIFEIRDLLRDIKTSGQPLASPPESAPTPEPSPTPEPRPDSTHETASSLDPAGHTEPTDPS